MLNPCTRIMLTALGRLLGPASAQFVPQVAIERAAIAVLPITSWVNRTLWGQAQAKALSPIARYHSLRALFCADVFYHLRDLGRAILSAGSRSSSVMERPRGKEGHISLSKPWGICLEISKTLPCHIAGQGFHALLVMEVASKRHVGYPVYYSN